MNAARYALMANSTMASHVRLVSASSRMPGSVNTMASMNAAIIPAMGKAMSALCSRRVCQLIFASARPVRKRDCRAIRGASSGSDAEAVPT